MEVLFFNCIYFSSLYPTPHTNPILLSILMHNIALTVHLTAFSDFEV